MKIKSKFVILLMLIFCAQGNAQDIGAANAAQQTRENAAIAAWWASGTAIVSGAAAALGGFVAVIT